MEFLKIILSIMIVIFSITLNTSSQQFCNVTGSVPTSISYYEPIYHPTPSIELQGTLYYYNTLKIHLYGLNLTRGLSDKMKTYTSWERTLNGLTLEIRCFLANGNYFGSCVYDDLCEMIEIYRYALYPDEPKLSCPFNVLSGIHEFKLDLILPSLYQTDLSFLSNGDYRVKIHAFDNFGTVFCWPYGISFKVTPASNIPASD